MAKHQKKKKLGSYPYLSVIFSITLALFVIGIFALLVLHTAELGKVIRENIEVQVYLEKNITDNERIQIQKTLSARPYAAVRNEEVQISFVSKEEAAELFIQETGEDFSEFLGQNPLRDAYNLKISTPYQPVDSMRMIKSEIENMNGVFEVTYVENLVQEINRNATIISLWLVGIAILLLIIVVLLINNTIKLALYSQRFLIRSMQLVGATRGFIRRPFLWRSLLHGFIAGLIASATLYALLRFAGSEIEKFSAVPNPEKIGLIFGGLILLGALIAWASTFGAVQRYVRMSLDELY